MKFIYYEHIMAAFNQQWTNFVHLPVLTVSSLVVSTTVPKWLHEALIPLAMDLEKYIPQPYAGEIRGLASHLGTPSDVIILNFAYEISAYVWLKT